MKRVLSLLLCYVFLQAQTFALRGGPAGQNGNVVFGAYSGVLIDASTTPTDLGIFLVNVPSAGGAAGQVVIWSSGTVVQASGATVDFSGAYLGSLTGLSDTSRGGSGRLYGIFNAAGNGGDIAGSMTVTAVPTVGNRTQRITGTASASARVTQTGGAGGGGTTVIGVTVPKSYTIDGWRSSSQSVQNGFSLGTSGSSN